MTNVGKVVAFVGSENQKGCRKEFARKTPVQSDKASTKLVKRAGTDSDACPGDEKCRSHRKLQWGMEFTDGSSAQEGRDLAVLCGLENVKRSDPQGRVLRYT
ncbi:hypothetical protein OUZ56_017676 [Daphnia magna]|uniref:Uncharacterized protein n=1 Tax=Daphnia magna TaxID=35525 RepID=A0ABR0ATG4_9CRUS|nr:hypothetical protein OUZ56_017676 [Daphnia magna]